MTGLTRDRWLAGLLLAWAALAIVAIELRPLWPVDETRYASVAWEMWLRGDVLVPYVNGEPYSHKPPLLFWLIHAGWLVFGVNDWWPRLVAPLCALAVLLLQNRLAQLLWPDRRDAGLLAAWVLCGTALFAAMVTLTMFDLLLAACVLVGMIGVVRAARGDSRPGLLWLSAGIGLGVLAKGPVILLHLLPAALVAPLCLPRLRSALTRWYGGILGAVLLGAAIALVWAVPAGYFGGEAYRRAIFWGQTAGRVAESFAHRAPWWYYLPILPAMFFPWLVWPALWRGLRTVRFGLEDPSARLVAAWLLLVTLAFSLVSGKQAKYLVPALPAFALLAGYALEHVRSTARSWTLLVPACGFWVLPAVLLYAMKRPAALDLPAWSATLPLWPVIVAALVPLVLFAFLGREMIVQVRALAFATLASLTIMGAGVVPSLVPYADVRPVAQRLAELQRKGVALAHLGKYHAQYNFAGRLAQPIAILDEPELASWVAAHPAGQVIVVDRRQHSGGAARPEYEAPYRGAWVQIWRGDALAAAKASR